MPSHEWVHSLPLAMPALVTVTLKLEQNSLCFDPPLNDIVAQLNSVLEACVSGTSSVPCITAHVMHMLNLPEAMLATLDVNDAALKAARVALNEMIARSMRCMPAARSTPSPSLTSHTPKRKPSPSAHGCHSLARSREIRSSVTCDM